MTKTLPQPALPNGHLLQNYRIVRKIGGGGFSVVYLAYDADNKQVIIKEYLPTGLADRDANFSVSPNSEDNARLFKYGMRLFFEEGRALTGINHPNIVKVENFFRANETVYLVMKYEQGRTLQDHIRAHPGEITEGLIRRVFAALLNGLRDVHAHKLLHLDIKPGNIYIRTDGSPVLIDFGATRQSFNKEHQKILTMYTPGFAAPEQYQQGSDHLGPWTDIYGIGASMYACLSGAAPPAADVRLIQDKLVPAVTAWRGKYSRRLLQTIDVCLRLDTKERPPSVFVLQKELLDTKKMEMDKPTLMDNIKEVFNKIFL